ncbi:MAG: hypothetical protein HKL80_09410 [Acidimicrobiales bacterium]|nr:hypothetical protein [Acidimicrobiales bacterium]
MIGSSFYSMLSLAVGSVLVCAIIAIWVSSTRLLIRVLAAQGFALGIVALVLGVHERDLSLMATAVVVLAIKGVFMPLMLAKVGSRSLTNLEPKPLVNIPASLAGSAVLIVLAFGSSRVITTFVNTPIGALAPVGVATLLIGFFVLVARRKPVFQMVGLMLVDNGIDLVAFLCSAGVPFLIELGVSLDVLLAVVVLMVLAQRLASEFGDLDVGDLRELHD